MSMILQIPYLYCHGSENRFILLDETKSEIKNDSQRKKIAILIGENPQLKNDGTLYISKNHCLDEKAQFSMRMFNNDGSEAEMCGNGLRCAGRYVMEEHNLDSVNFATQKAVLQVKKSTDIFANITGYESQIGLVTLQIPSMNLPNKTVGESFIGQKLPLLNNILDENILFTALTIPNPHLVGLSEEPVNHQQVLKAWNFLNETSIFPEGINLSIVTKIAKEKNAILVKTCERGVGLTNACGTAMTASAYVASRENWLNAKKTIAVYNPGGMVYCKIPTNNHFLKLIGNATWINQGVVELDTNNKQINFTVKKTFQEEQNHYKKLQQYAKDLLQ